MTVNPWNPDYGTGGSSGGSGSGGRRRAGRAGARLRRRRLDPAPRGVCGLFGLKPQRGRVSLLPDLEHWKGSRSTAACRARRPTPRSTSTPSPARSPAQRRATAARAKPSFAEAAAGASLAAADRGVDAHAVPAGEGRPAGRTRRSTTPPTCCARWAMTCASRTPTSAAAADRAVRPALRHGAKDDIGRTAEMLERRVAGVAPGRARARRRAGARAARRRALDGLRSGAVGGLRRAAPADDAAAAQPP